MMTRVLLTVLVLTIALSALALAQPLPPQGPDATPSAVQATVLNATDNVTGFTADRTVTGGTTGAAVDRDYWTNEMGTVSSTDRTAIMNRAQTVLSGYTPESFIMPASTLNDAISSNNPNLYLIDVSPAGGASGATSMPLSSLGANYNNIPADRTIVVVSDDDIDSAVAVTLLRIAGYNAWIGQGGISAVQRSAGTTGTAGNLTGRSSGTSDDSQNGDGDNFGIGNATGTVGSSGPTSGSGAATHSGSS